MSLTEFCTRLLSEPLILIKTLLTYWWIKLWRPRHRLHLYDTRDMETTRRGPFILPIEKELEEPAQLKDDNVVDSVLVFGVNSLGDRLLARVSRERKGHVPWLYLKLSDGRSYQLASTEDVFPPSDYLSAGGLRIKCLLPMRKWRISFNGLLRECKEGMAESTTLHVQFSFLCFSSAPPLDLIQGIATPVLADVLGRESSFHWPPRINNVPSCLDRFVQSVNFVGTIKFGDEEEKEMNLWGIRQRSKDVILWSKETSASLTEIIGYTQDCQVIYAGEYHLPNYKQRLVFGLHLERSGFFWPVKNCSINMEKSRNAFPEIQICIKSERNTLEAKAGVPVVSLNKNAGVNKGFTARVNITDLQTEDGDTGNTVAVQYHWKHEHKDLVKSAWIMPPLDLEAKSSRSLVLPLEEQSCKLPSLTGGKGSSLANLSYLSKEYPTNFIVPTGFVVTTEAYKEFVSTTAVKSMFSIFEKTVWCSDYESLRTSCQRLVDNVSKVKLPVPIQKAVLRVIQNLCPGDITGKRFAVRSSASGEDSEDMSAAGQMSTFLGVVGIDNIFESIVKCWASQFSFTAIQYKRQNGQELNSMMAVVVQEMVPADTAGVLFTCDPLTGNPQNVTITANYGIGESVVSASAEPDTVVLFRGEKQQLTLKSVQVGRKNLKIVMTDEGSVTEEFLDEHHKSVCSISEESALKLGRTCLKIEEAYGVPLDIEWAYRGNQLYMLQARPVTTFDKETKCELLHSMDDTTRTESEYSTSANSGEVMPNAASHLGCSLMRDIVTMATQFCFSTRNPYSFPMTPFTSMVVMSCNFCLLSMSNFILRFHRNGEKSFLSEAGLVAGFGRIIDDQDMYDQIDRRNKSYPTTFVPYQMMFFIYDMLFGLRKLDNAVKRFSKETNSLSHCLSAKAMFVHIWKDICDTTYAMGSHFTSSINSSLYNNLVMSVLRTATKEWNTDVFSDFSLILSSCGNLESADIPQSIHRLAEAIAAENKAEEFKKMAPEDALNWLETTESQAGEMFKKFISQHGHRCLMEFDVYSKPWRNNKLPVIKVLQESIGLPHEEKKFVPAWEIIKKMKSPLSWFQKVLLVILIPLCRKSVMSREKSKSLSVKKIDRHRQDLCTLAEQMVKEGRLPDKELLFFLSAHEILQLLDTRNPTLVQTAIRRRAFFPELSNLRHPEICRGVPKPINTKDKINYDNLPSDLEVRGTPVSQGVTEGYARVAVTLEDAALIKRGEILIAYSTDIAWSPYFPLLSGVTTELGGLISHGAVVAREYGLPCVVGVADATLKFKSGDYVLLDGNKGILKRIPRPEEQNQSIQNSDH